MKNIYLYCLMACLSIVISACGGGGGGGAATSPVGNIEGAWLVSETSKNSNCELETGLQSYTLTVRQSNSALTIIDDEGNSYSSTLSGSNFSWTGSYEEDAPDRTPGTLMLNPVSATVNSSCDSLNGTANWTWTATDGSGYSCSGTTSFNATRDSKEGCGNSDGSDPINGDAQAPSIPQNVEVEASSSTGTTIRWSMSTDNVGVTGYKIFRNGSFLADAGLSVSYNDSGLFPSKQYCYTVLSYDAAGNESAESLQTAYSCATTLPSGGADVQAPTVPANLVATAVSSSRIDLSWSASSDNVAVTAYNIYRNGNFIKSVTTSPSFDSGLIASTNYCYRVLAKDAAGNTSSQSAQVCKFTNPAAETTPAAPSNISVSNITHNSARMSWTDNSDNETGFQIGSCTGLVSSNSSYMTCSYGFNVIATTPGTEYTFTGLQSSMTYTYFVRAYNSMGSSANRGVKFTTVAAPSVSTLTITNNLSGSGANQVLQLRVATTESLVLSDRNELLDADDLCYYGGLQSIDPGQNKTITVNDSIATNGYYVFFGLGIEDSSLCSYQGYFAKKMNIDILGTGFIWSVIRLPSGITDGKNVDLRLGYYGNNLVTRVYIDGVFNTMIYMSATANDPTTP